MQKEIDILGKVNCPYIARLVAADRPSGILATQLVDGENLEKKVQLDRRLSSAQVVQIGMDICRALEALHAENWIHKDVKPSNIILDRFQRAVLIDFGLAEKQVELLRLPVGTPYYIAPEVFFPEFTPDARADVYSLAAKLYRLLSGHPPHFHHCLQPNRPLHSRAELDVRRFRFADAATECDLEDLRREVPRQLCQLLIQGLSANRDQRPSSAAVFRAALENIEAKLNEAVKN